MEKLFSRCKRCGLISDVPYMLICPRCGADMYTSEKGEDMEVTPEKFGPFSAYKSMFKKATDFKTRSRRSEYWYAYLMNFIISLIFIAVLSLVEYFAGENLTASGDYARGYVTAYNLIYNIFIIYSFVTLIPWLSLTVRRLHDIGKNPFFAVFSFSPILSFVLIYFMVQDSAPGMNIHGPNPKGR